MQENLGVVDGSAELPQSDEAFDVYVANESFQTITKVKVMEAFLVRAARRFHVLAAEMSAAVNADEVLPLVKQEAWQFGRFNFGPSSDLQMFFSETDDFYEQTPQERRHLIAVADSLVGSAQNALKIDLVVAAIEKKQANDLLVKIDQSFDGLNSVLDSSGALETESIQRAVYKLRLAIAEALGDDLRISAAKETLEQMD